MKIMSFGNFIKESVVYEISDVESVALSAKIELSKYDINEVMMGIEVELEHGTRSKDYNITNDDLLTTLKIALAHIDENPKYYTVLKRSGID